jgi:hypothetical protein
MKLEFNSFHHIVRFIYNIFSHNYYFFVLLYYCYYNDGGVILLILCIIEQYRDKFLFLL